KSFARIHRANLINWGIVPLTFDDPAAYDTIERDDPLHLPDLRAALKAGTRVTVANRRTRATFTTSCLLTPRERDILLAGGVLSYTKGRSCPSIACERSTCGEAPAAASASMPKIFRGRDASETRFSSPRSAAPIPTAGSSTASAAASRRSRRPASSAPR